MAFIVAHPDLEPLRYACSSRRVSRSHEVRVLTAGPGPAPEEEGHHQRVAENFLPLCFPRRYTNGRDSIETGLPRLESRLRVRVVVLLYPGVPEHQFARLPRLIRDLLVGDDLGLVSVSRCPVWLEHTELNDVLRPIPRAAVEPQLVANDAPAEISPLVRATQ